MALIPSTWTPADVSTLARMTGVEILTTYGPEMYRLVGELQGGGQMVRDGRSHFDLEITDQVRRDIILKEGDCRCGKIDCWKRELGID